MKNKTVKYIIFTVLSLMYLGGLVCMFFNFGLGLIIWAAALLPSFMIFLYQRHQETLAAEEKAEEAANAEQDK